MKESALVCTALFNILRIMYNESHYGYRHWQTHYFSHRPTQYKGMRRDEKGQHLETGSGYGEQKALCITLYITMALFHSSVPGNYSTEPSCTMPGPWNCQNEWDSVIIHVINYTHAFPLSYFGSAYN